jgi:hypothetical protein
MGILEKLLGSKTTITSATIKAEIDYSEGEIKRLQAQIGPKLAAVATMSDAEHVKAEADIAVTKRAIARLDARIAHLQSELPAVLAAEEAATKAAADEALRKRAEAARKANTKTSASLLVEYDDAAAKIGDILTKLKAMDAEREAVNIALRSNPVAETVEGYSNIHRTTPGTEATEHRERRKCWVYRFPGSPPDTGKTKFQYEAPREEVRPATVDADGKVTAPGGTEIHNYYGREIVITPTLEERDIVVSRSPARPPRYEHPLDDVRLPPAFAGGQWAWPRS